MSERTRGKWEILEPVRGYDYTIGVKRDDGVEAVADIPSGLRRGDSTGNARLISAAPDMLAVLQSIDRDDVSRGLWSAIERAIKKAEGSEAPRLNVSSTDGELPLSIPKSNLQ